MIDVVHISTHTARVKRPRKNNEPDESQLVGTEKTNLSLKRKLKHPGIKLAESMGYTLSEFVERLLEIQLVKAGKIKRPFLDDLRTEEKKEIA